MRTPPLLDDFIHPRNCKPICEKLLTLPQASMLGALLKQLVSKRALIFMKKLYCDFRNITV